MEQRITQVDQKHSKNPYPGLRPFKIEESYLFFGREGQSDEVLLKLSRHRFVGIVGPSGSGKSSFVFCGVLPILYGGLLTEVGSNWKVVVTRPGSSPVDNLSEALLNSMPEYVKSNKEDKQVRKTITSSLLRSSSLGLVEAIQQFKKEGATNYLILVDQFEELFRFKSIIGSTKGGEGMNEILNFISIITEAANYEDFPIYVAITMRSDFIGECSQFAELTKKLNDSHYLIPQMTRDQKRDAIIGPAAVGQSKIAPRLVQQLLNDLGDSPDQLPILQHALMRTWNYWYHYREREDELIDLQHYEAIGTMSEALSLHANEAYDELNEEQRQICEVTFKAITEKRGEGHGVRRPTRLNEIASISDVSENDVIEVLNKFRTSERAFIVPGLGSELTGESYIDISHESLMRIWTRLSTWVEDEEEAVQTYMRLAEGAALYQIGKAGLWRMPDLQLALNWKIKQKPTLVWGQRYHPAYERTMLFLEYSKQQYDTEQRIKELEARRKLRGARVIAIVFGVLAMLALVAVVYAFVQQGIAKENEQAAILQEAEAQRYAQVARENEEVAKRQQKRAEQNAELAQRQSAEARRQSQIALQNELLARQERVRAEKNASLARTNAQRAAESAQRANAAAASARQERYRAIAKAMAVKSKELNDSEQQSLVAQQAYNFHKEYGGYEYDNDIYNGLYAALKKNNDPLTVSLEAHKYGGARALCSDVINQKLYSGGSDGRLFQWSYNVDKWENTPIVEQDRGSHFQIYALALSPNSRYLVAGGLAYKRPENNYVEIYDLQSLSSPPKIVEGFQKAINDIHFDSEGKGFYVRDNSGYSIRYSTIEGEVTEVIRTEEKVKAISMDPNGVFLAGVSEYGNLFFWDVTRQFQQTAIKISDRELSEVAYSPDGKKIVIGDHDGLIEIVEDGEVTHRLTGHISVIDQIRFNFNGTFLATTSKDFQVRLWNFNQLNHPPIVLTSHDWVWDAAFTPDDEQIMLAIHSVRVNVRDVDQTIHAYPTKIKTISQLLCKYVERNLTDDEWEIYVGSDVNKEITCADVSAD